MTEATKRKVWQKVTGIIGYISFAASTICLIVLAFYRDDMDKVYTASVAASAFFFFSVGFVLQVISTTNLPKLHASSPSDEQ